MSPDTSATVTDQTASTDLLQMITGYQVTQVLYVAAALGVADALSAGPRSADEIAHITGAHPPALVRLLRALAAFDVLRELAADHFALTPLGACLQSSVPGSLRALALMHGGENFWQVWGDLLHSVQTGESAVHHLFGVRTPFEYYAQHPAVAATVNEGMTALAAVSAPAVVAAYDFPGSGRVVDVGGGQGHLLTAILQAHPTLQGILFDLPHVVAGADRLLEAAGVAGRCRIVSGDLFVSLPTDGDLYLLSRILHDWDDEQAVTALRSCHRAMPAQATLLLVERVRPARVDRSASAQAQVLSDLTMLVRTGGRERTGEEYAALLRAAGFAPRGVIKARSAVSLVEARRV